MSKLKNVYNGNTYMTKQNAQRYFLKRLSIAIGNKDVDKCDKLLDKMIDNGLYCSFRCEFCPHDDIGYCGLRRSKISDEEIKTRYCFPSVLKGLLYDYLRGE